MATDSWLRSGYHSVNSYLVADSPDALIAWLCEVFDGTERGVREIAPDGRIGHAEIQIGDSVIMMADPFPEMGVVDPKKIGGTPITMYVYVEDVDATFADAIKAGAKQLEAVEDKFYGDRSGQFEDPWGHRWGVTTHIEDVSPQEM